MSRTCVLLLALASSCCALVTGQSHAAAAASSRAVQSRRNVLGRIAVLPLFVTPTVASAYNELVGIERSQARKMADSTAAPLNFSGRYADPQHPGCPRKVGKSGKFVTIEGADEDGKKWTVKGQTNGRDLLLDFSAKGGPKDVLARADSIGITFPDGNVWKKQL
mmetsp:Transcript_17584/g.39685  ORF Transcript_17584/g.39685 Transcript_17584/m.39685 type:complete len:164 (-) Transcript_17584:94-585(-)